jgi:hypothetical protein
MVATLLSMGAKVLENLNIQHLLPMNGTFARALRVLTAHPGIKSQI